MVSVETLKEQFDELGVDPSDDVVEKCEFSGIGSKSAIIHFIVYFYSFSGLELGSIYHLDDPVEFVEKWMAFSISHLDGAEPTVQFLIDFENKELKNQNKSNAKQKRAATSEISQLKVYNQESDDEENDILGAYVCMTPKVSAKFHHRVNFLLRIDENKSFATRSPRRVNLS